MEAQPVLPPARDKTLLTPGPLTTSQTIKQAMLRDFGSRDEPFIATIRDIRRRLVHLAGETEADYTAVLMQGSGTFAIEATVGSVIPRDGKLLVIINGAYGRRIAAMAAVLGIAHTTLQYAEDSLPNLEEVRASLQADPAITHVALVHCETTSGLLNPLAAIGGIVREAGRLLIVDAMSSFGAVPITLSTCGVDYLISSSNKCIEGAPGFAFVLARTAALLATEGCARSLSLDVLAQWRGFESNGQFRFTPPTHVLLAFQQALNELEAEGGVAGRAARYAANHSTLITGMRALGFREYIQAEHQSSIITSFFSPEHPAFTFQTFYEHLSQRDYIIYPGKVGNADCFRIGTIGRIFVADIRGLLAAIRETLQEMEVY